MAGNDLSRLVALAWGVAAAPQRGPKRELSHERIVEAAIAIADAEGLQAVTMQRVAQTFGFTTMALYRYISSKDDLHQLMLDASAADDDWPIDVDDWRVGLQQWAARVRQIYVKHPWALDISLSMEALLMPGQMRAVNAGMRALRTLPGPAEAKLGALMTISVHMRGFAAVERELDSDSPIDEATRRLVLEVATDGRLPDLEPLLRSGTFFGDDGEGDDVEIAMSMLIPGIERTFAAFDGESVEPAEHLERTPEQALVAAETALEDAIALRKATQQRVRALERDEARAREARDRARTAAKEAAKEAARVAKQVERDAAASTAT